MYVVKFITVSYKPKIYKLTWTFFYVYFYCMNIKLRILIMLDCNNKSSFFKKKYFFCFWYCNNSHTSYSLSSTNPSTATIWYCLALSPCSVLLMVLIIVLLITVRNCCICFFEVLGSKINKRNDLSVNSSTPTIVLLWPTR